LQTNVFENLSWEKKTVKKDSCTAARQLIGLVRTSYILEKQAAEAVKQDNVNLPLKTCVARSGWFTWL